MALMLKNGAVFLHIPKTGGKWIEKVLRDCNLVRYKFTHNHADMNRVMNFAYFYPTFFLRKLVKHGPTVQSDIRKSFKFCFVRHPLKYYESYFKYAWSLDWPVFPGLGNNEKDTWHPNSPLFDIGDREFNQFIRNVIKTTPGYVSNLYNSFTSPHIDFIGKTENLVEDLITVLKKMELDFDEDLIRNSLPVNVSKKPKEIIIWDEHLKKEILKLEYAAVVKYNYEKNDK